MLRCWLRCCDRSSIDLNEFCLLDYLDNLMFQAKGLTWLLSLEIMGWERPTLWGISP